MVYFGREILIIFHGLPSYTLCILSTDNNVRCSVILMNFAASYSDDNLKGFSALPNKSACLLGRKCAVFHLTIKTS